jgi:alkanesulfonate monooxygenase SsuD/methylene tetrahydromethanopterin reductase-like flavin-dependent oxidoreductase (luciferase family)
VGAREDDYRAAGVDFHARGRQLNEQLKLIKQVWSGEPLSADTGPIVPAPVRASGPELLIGGYSPEAIRRIARWGDGYIAGGGAGSAQIQEMIPRITEAWQAANRPGKPRVVAAFYCALESGGASRAGAYIHDYYGFLGPRAEAMANALPLTAEAIRDRIKSYAAAGVDELILWPCIPDPDQVDGLAEIVRSVADL